MEVKKGWKKEKRDSLLERNVTEVAYTFTKEDGSLWQIVADYRGAKFKGESPYLATPDQLEACAWVLSDAMRMHLQLKRARLHLAEVTPIVPGN